MKSRWALFRIGSSGSLRALLLAAVALGVTALAIVAYGAHLLRTLELSTVNTRFSIRGSDRPPENIVVVKVDDKTFSDLNLQWPFPRATHARLLNRIGAEHPAVIAFDVQFSEPSNLPKVVKVQGQTVNADDNAFLMAINNFPGKTVFSFTETDRHGGVRFLGYPGGPLLNALGARAGNGLYPFDPGGVIRRMSYSIGGLDTFSVVVADVAKHRPLPRAGSHKGTAWIGFVGPTGTFPSVSYSQAYYDTYSGTPHGARLPRNFFRNKIVVIGATDPTLLDIHPTSTDSQMPGPEIQANAIDTVLRGFPLSSAPGWINVVLIVLLAVAVPLVSLRLGPVAATGIAVALGAAFAVAVQLAFDAGSIVSFVYPFGALILSAGGSLAVQMVTEAFERIRTRDLFARFVPENVVDEVLASADGLRLGGIQRDGTVMFTDLRGFTSKAESLEPARVIDILNHYLGEMSDAILNHGGTLVAYMGDGIMAVFGAPLPQDDHADRALSAAREMLSVRLPRFNAWIRSEGLGEGFRMGIGLNSGPVMSGHVGSERRVEYTAVGDTTNTASRIEALTKGTPNQLLLAGSTRETLRSPQDDLVRVGDTEIRGRVGKLELWSIPEASPEEAAPAEPVPAAGPAA